MGRSDKKTKSQRITVLKKQYETLLVEDKKRKARNEYILGKFDEMRLGSSLVANKPKADYPDRLQNPTHTRIMAPLEKVSPTSTKYFGTRSNQPLNEQLENQASDELLENTHDVPSLIKEILSKYILIPKRKLLQNNQGRESVSHDLKPIKHDNDDNVNWQRKYEILNQLKKSEKGLEDNEDIQLNEIKKQITFENQLSTSDHQHYIPEKDNSYDNLGYGEFINVQQNDTSLYESAERSFPENYNINTEEHNESPMQEETKHLLNDTESEIDTQYSYEPVVLSQALPTTINEFPEANKIVPQMADGFDDKMLDVEQVFTVDQEAIEFDENNEESEDLKYTDETIEVNDSNIDDTSADHVEYPVTLTSSDDLGENVIINPEYGMNEIDVSQIATEVEKKEIYEPETLDENVTEDFVRENIQEYEAEPHEMFYQNSAEENFVQEVDTVEDEYHEEPSQPVQPSYLDETHDRAYTAEVNELREVLQPYDQNYAEQYLETPKQEYFEKALPNEPPLQNYEINESQLEAHSNEQLPHQYDPQQFAQVEHQYDPQQFAQEEPQLEQTLNHDLDTQNYDGQSYSLLEHQNYNVPTDYVVQEELVQEYDQQQHYKDQLYDQQEQGGEQYDPQVYSQYENPENTGDTQKIAQELDNEQGYTEQIEKIGTIS